MASDSTAHLLRRDLLGLAALTALALAVELGLERHWSQPSQLVAWVADAVALGGVALLSFGRQSAARVRIARLLAVGVTLSALAGIWFHVASNYDAGPLDFHYTYTWEGLSELTRWWLAATKSVGPSPVLAPGALAQAGLCIVLATLRHPALADSGAAERRPKSEEPVYR